MNKYVKKVVVVGLLSVALLNLTGCEYANLKKEIKSQKAVIESLEAEGLDLQAQKDGLTVTEVINDTSLYTVDGATIPTFQTVEGKVKFPNKLTLPNSTQDINNSHIMIGSMFKYNPSDNWLVRMNGATLEVNHPAAIWGNIKSIVVTGDALTEEQMKPILQGFFNKFPATTIEYRRIYMADLVIGMMATANIVVDKKPHVVNVGLMTRGEYGQIFLMDYADNKTGVQQELIDLLLSSGSFGDEKITLE
jgi:hypothetical protein